MVCTQLAEWTREGLPLVPVSINVSPQQFARGRFQDTVESVTREHGIDPSLLWLEITENAVMHDIEQHLGSLHALRRLGAKIAVDDFGTGYSSLSYLKHLPIDALKVDRSFVRDMATDPQRRGDRHGNRAHGAQPRAAHRRRRRGDGRAARTAAPARLRFRTGLLLRPPDGRLALPRRFSSA